MLSSWNASMNFVLTYSFPNSGHTLLHLAVVEGRTAEVALLLDRRANSNVKDKE
jgi:hypothetical protein